MAQKIYIGSRKGGAGATTCAVEAGRALARNGERVLIIDGDCNFSAALNIADCGGMQTYSLEEARKGACRVKQAIVSHPRSSNLFILPCAGCHDKKFITEAAAEVEGAFDIVLCDKAALSLCTRGAAVAEPYPTGIQGADAMLAEMRDGGIKDVGVIVNKVNGGLLYDGAIMPPEDIAALLHAPLWGVIPEDLGIPLMKMRADSARALRMTAAKLAGGGRKIFSPARAYYGINGYIKRKMRGRI